MSHALHKTQTQFFEFKDRKQPLRLRVGGELERFRLAYEIYGRMNRDRSNVILLFHAMTGSQHAAGINRRVPGVDGRWTEEVHVGWWDGFIGPGKALDTRRYCVMCVNYLGGCYGSTGPASVNPRTGKPWGPSFPVLRFSDIVDSQIRLLDELGVKKVHAAIGRRSEAISAWCWRRGIRTGYGSWRRSGRARRRRSTTGSSTSSR